MLGTEVTKTPKTAEIFEYREGADACIVIIHVEIMCFKMGVCKMLWEHRRKSLDTVNFGEWGGGLEN